MKKLLLSLMLIYTLTTNAQLTNFTDFEKNAAGTAYTRPIWQADGFTTDTWDNRLSTTAIDDGYAVSGTKSLKITYPQGGFGPDQSGCQIPLLIPSKPQYYMSYWLRFSDNFSWGTTSEGGKLPGLAGGDRCSGGASCDGTNGFSCRLMWRPGGKAVLYLYHMDKPATYGEDIDLIYPSGDNVMFEKGKWYHVMERVKINTDGTTYDGEVEVWINGKKVLLRTGLRFTSNGDMVDNLYISTFHGGSDATWSPTVTCYTWLDDIKISENKADVDYLSCKGPNIGADKSICGVSSVTLDAGIESPNCTYQWIKDGVTIGTQKTYTATTTGTYMVVYDSLGCVRKDTVVVKNVINPNLGADQKICNQSFITLSANDEGPAHQYTWSKDGTILTNEMQSSISTSKAGTYKVTVSAAGCTSASDEVIVTSDLLDVNDDTICPGEQATISVNGNPSYNWYATESDHTILYNSNIIAPVVMFNTTFFVEDANGYSGIVGKLKPITPNYTDNRFDRRMMFTVYRTLTIDSISVYPTATENVTIRILASDQTTVVFTKTFDNLAAGEARIALNAELAAGSYYMDAVGTTGTLRHSYENDTDIKFPYTVEGLISITGANLAWINAKPYYLFFYKWRVSAGNSCARTPVSITFPDSCVIANIDKIKENNFSIYPNPAGEKITVGSLQSAKNSNNTIEIANLLGETVFTDHWPLTTDHFQIDVSRFEPGIYFIKIGNTVQKFIKE